MIAEPRITQLTLSRVRINICEWGDPSAPPLILQHGGRDHARSWDWVAAAFASSHRVIAPDLRGHGDSEWTNDGRYAIMDYVEDFAGIVRALDLPPCPIIGHSLGGNIATRFAGLFPEKVTRLINIEGLGDAPEEIRRLSAQDPLPRLRTWIERRIDLTRREPRDYPDLTALIERMRKTDHRLPADVVEHLAIHAARRNADGSLRLKHDPAMGANSPIDIGPEVKSALWSAVTCPVLLVYGTESWAKNPVEDGRAAWFSDARLELFEHAAHWVHHDRREDFIALAQAFLA